ncbi:hypothetical protein MSPP1_001429 [Malassezia sp. CBS 17886]|nr:hypothetical protein MSPP1_001429 [Malassezia sp. CBS 17886]
MADEESASRLLQPGDSRVRGAAGFPLTAQAKPGLMDALLHMNLAEELKRLPQIPCARSSLLFGIASGTSIGAIQFLAGRGMNRTLNWATGTFLFVAVCGWETCRRTHKGDQAHIQEIVRAHAKRREREA